MSAAGGCGSQGSCQCQSQTAGVPLIGEAVDMDTGADEAQARVNGVALHPEGERPDDYTLRERAWGELLRQEAVAAGLLPAQPHARAPALETEAKTVIESMLDSAIDVPVPTDDECRRYYDARRAHFALGRRVHARHILFAVTPGVNVMALAARAEQSLLVLRHKDVAPGRFAELAAELSNCPSGGAGGDIGWIGPDDCADELTAHLFHDQEALDAVGLHPRLVHSRYGLHILEVLERHAGRPQSFEEVLARIRVQLAQQSRAKALHQYMQLLAGRAVVLGVQLEGADSPLVQ